jgi:hypothetical protein
MRENAKTQMCINPHHIKPVKAGSRGLCTTCYRYASYFTLKGGLTWDELEKRGVAKPKLKRRESLLAWIEDRLDITQEEMRKIYESKKFTQKEKFNALP